MSIGTKPADCCAFHRIMIVICSCGFEQECRGEGVSDSAASSAIDGHRIMVLEEAVGIKFSMKR